jgi:hypothetical protein
MIHILQITRRNQCRGAVAHANYRMVILESVGVSAREGGAPSNMTRFLASLAFAVVFLGCSPPAPIAGSSIGGRYVGSYFDGIESIDLRLDGTFSQVFQSNGRLVYTNSGRWLLKTNQVLELRPFVGLLDYQGHGNNNGRSNWTESISALFFPDPDRIEFGEWPYFAVRQTTRAE